MSRSRWRPPPRHPAALAPALAVLLCASLTPADDLVIKRDGSSLSAPVASCVGAVCMVGGQQLPRQQIAWIGFAADPQAPPPAAAPTAQDQVHLRDGGVVVGEVRGISLGTVAGVAVSWERAEVAWVGFAGPPAEEPTGAYGAPPADPPPPPPPSPPAGDPPPGGDAPGGGSVPPPRRPPNEQLVRPCPPDRPLGGHVRYHYDVADRTYQRCTGSAELWFDLHSGDQRSPWPHPLYPVWHSSRLTYRMHSHGCTDLPGTDEAGANHVCTAPASPEVAGEIVFGEVGELGVNLLGAPDGVVDFIPLRPELTFGHLPDEIMDRLEVPITCVNPRGGGGRGAWTLPVMGAIGTAETGYDCGDDHPHVVCVPATACAGHIDDEQDRDCALHPDRYAVVPFTGSEVARRDQGGTHIATQIRWQVCCGCGEPPSGPPPELEQDPCGDLAAARAQLTLKQDVFAARQAELGSIAAQVAHEQSQAAAYQSDYDLVVQSCALWDIAVALATYLATGPRAPPSAQQFGTLLTVLQQLANQDPSLVFTAFGAGGLKIAGAGIDAYWGALLSNGQALLSLGEAGSIPGMRAKIDACTDTPMVSHEVFRDARVYLDHLEAVARLLPDLHVAYRSTEQAGWDLWAKQHDYHEFCLLHAACAGTDPAACGPPPLEMPPAP